MADGKRKLKQVKIRLYEDNVEEAKKIAERDARSYHAVLRDIVDNAIGKKKKVVS